MQLSALAEQTPSSAFVSDRLIDYFFIEADTGLPRAKFKYSNYHVDPRPEVLVLGTFNSTKGNKLLAGINLHYLSNNQQLQLLNEIPRLQNISNLKDRYWYLRKKHPDIAQYYRTYDHEEIRSLELDKIDPSKAKLEPEDPKKAERDIERTAQVAAGPPEKEEPEEDPDAKKRQAWELKRRLRDPETGEPQKPEDDEIAKSRKAKLQILKRRREQKKELRDLERQAELDRISRYLEKRKEKETAAAPRQSKVADVYEARDVPGIGTIWPSRQSYIRHHSLPRISRILDEGRLLVVYNTVTGERVADQVDDHSEILCESGWDYDNTILLEYDGRELIARCDNIKHYGKAQTLLESVEAEIARENSKDK